MKLRMFVLCLSLGAAAPSVVWTTVAVAAETYPARGSVESIAADRKSLRIAHETIAGYMPAMTMSFEVSAPSQLDGVAKGDRVRFTFTATEDGRRVLGVITKEPPK